MNPKTRVKDLAARPAAECAGGASKADKRNIRAIGVIVDAARWRRKMERMPTVATARSALHCSYHYT